MDELTARLRAVEQDLAIARRERDALRAELIPCREDRDRLTLGLAETRAELAAATRSAAEQAAALTAAAERVTAAEDRIALLAAELAATRRTLSWRVTRPLRAVRRRTRRV